MSDDNPTVSVIIPCYNRELTLSKTLDSALSQTVSDLEIIVVDDGSTDSSPQILQDYAARFPGKIRVFITANGGPYPARNLAIREARGRYISFLDSDDYWDEHIVAKELEVLRANAALGLVHAGVTQVTGDGEVYRRRTIGRHYVGDCFRKLLIRNGIGTSSVMVPRHVFEKVGDFDEQYAARGDWEMWTRIASEFPVGYVNEPLLFYRVHDGMMSSNAKRMRHFQLAIIEGNHQRYSGVVEDIDQLTEDARFHCYFTEANDAVWSGRPGFATDNYLKAIRTKPLKLGTYIRAIYGVIKALLKKALKIQPK